MLKNTSETSFVTVIGFGSLLAESSARETIPNLINFRLVRVDGYRRIFNKVGVSFLYRYSMPGNPEARNAAIASCSTEVDPHNAFIGCAFDCPAPDFPALYDREHRFRWVEASFQVLKLDGHQTDEATGTGRMCTQYTDADYRLNKCVTVAEYESRVGQYYGGKIWREDILPFPVYLKHCLDAASSHGTAVYQNFLESSFLADGVTTIKAFLQANPSYLDVDLPYTYTR